jgi:protein tyrosine/serine phosphatase
MSTRHYDLEGIRNFRDFGDYPAADGRRVVARRLFRSGSLSKPSAADLARLNALEVTLIVDLRRDYEREREPSAWPAPGDARVISGPADLQRAEMPTFITFLNRPDITPADSRAFTIAAFRDIAVDPLYLRLFGDGLRAIANTAGALVVHCSQGKDRTGLLCALTLHALGVPMEAILEDFELTNVAIDLKNRLPETRDAFARRYGVQASLEVLEPMLGVHADYLRAAFDGMAERCGSIDGYLAALGVDDAARDELRRRFLA